MRKTMAVLAALVLAAAALGTSYAAEPDRPEKRKDRPDVVAIALGVLKEPGGDQAIVDFRARMNGDNVRGNLRFYSKDEGYYNGAVRRLTVQDGVIKAAGAGRLLKPDGTGVPVRFEADFHAASKRVSIKATGREVVAYTLEGAFNPGFIKVLNPQDKERKR